MSLQLITPQHPPAVIVAAEVYRATRAQFTPINPDGTVDQQRAEIWRQLQIIWDPLFKFPEQPKHRAGGVYRKAHRRRIDFIAQLIGFDSSRVSHRRSIEVARLYEPQMPEAWFASYSNMLAEVATRRRAFKKPCGSVALSSERRVA